MMVHQREDLGLSLSLSFPAENNKNSNNQSASSSSTLQLNLMPSLVSSSPSPFNFFTNNSNFSSSSDRNLESCRVETRSFLKGIDVNRLPSTVDMEEEAGVSSPNSTLSSVSGKRSHERSELVNGDDLIDCSRGTNSEDEDGVHRICLEETLTAIMTMGHSRVPVYSGNPTNIIGIILNSWTGVNCSEGKNIRIVSLYSSKMWLVVMRQSRYHGVCSLPKKSKEIRGVGSKDSKRCSSCRSSWDCYSKYGW